MNVEIGAEDALCPEKEYINGIAVAVYKYIYSILVGVIIHIIHIGFVIHNITELGWFPAGEFVCPPLLSCFL